MKTYVRLLSYIRPYRVLVLVALSFLIITSLIFTLPMQIVGVAVENIRAEDLTAAAHPLRDSKIPIARFVEMLTDWVATDWFPASDRRAVGFYVLGVSFLLLHLASNVIGTGQDILTARVGQSVIYDLRNALYRHLQTLPLGYFHERKTGDIMSRVTSDVAQLEQAALEQAFVSLTNVCNFLWALGFCLIMDWKLTILAGIALPVFAVMSFVFGNLTRNIYRQIRLKLGDMSAFLKERITGIQVIQGFVREQHEADRFDEVNRENVALNVRGRAILTIFGSLTHLLRAVGWVVVLCYGGMRVVRGDLGAGVFVVFLQYQPVLLMPITHLSRIYNQIQAALASAERVFEILDTRSDVQERSDAAELKIMKGEIEFRDVSFSYTVTLGSIKGVNLQLLGGETVALVGPSGAGKTTLVSLLSRYYDPDRGVILIDGQNIKDVTLSSLRKQIGTVHQTPFLFNDTIGNNIAYGDLDATDEDIVAAAEAANAHDFIAKLPKQYDAMVGERGVKLSGGEKQRIVIARTILADPRILIFDEATSSVDSEVEALIQAAIFRLMKDRTTLIIAHRLSTVQQADRIIVIDGGRIVEIGTHQDLLTSGRTYARLYNAQLALDT